MTTYYSVSAPLGSGKTTAAIEHAGHRAQAGEKFVIAQPSIKLINQSLQQFRERWPNVVAQAIHGETTTNVAQIIAEHTRASSSGEILFITHSALMQCPYFDRREDWNLIIDEAPQAFWHAEFTLPVNYKIVLPALEAHPYNIRYSRIIPGDSALLEAIAENKGNDQVFALFQDFARKLSSNRWDMFVLSEQYERFQTGLITDGKLLIFGLIDTTIFNGFKSVTIMSANLGRTTIYQHLLEAGHSFVAHEAIESRLRFRKHENGDLLTIHYAVEDGNWSKRKRNQKVQVGDETFSVNDVIMSGAMELFGDDEFVWLVNKGIEEDAKRGSWMIATPFGGSGVMLPHSPHGLNCFQHIHNAAVVPALNPPPALYAFLEEVAHINPDEVRQAVYHESVYQAAGRISTRNLSDQTPKNLVVADRIAAEALAELYPGAEVVRLPFASLIPDGKKTGRRRIHASDAARKAEHRKRRKAELLAQLDRVNGCSSETELPHIKVLSSRTDPAFGGSLFENVGSKTPTLNCLACLRRTSSSFCVIYILVMSPRPMPGYGPQPNSSRRQSSTGRGLANITAIHGVFLDNDGGDLTPAEFAAMFPHLTMVIHNSSSSTLDNTKWRAIIPTTCAMTIEVHRDIMLQIRQALNRRGYFDKHQLEKKAKDGLSGKCHGFDPSKYTASSMFYLPGQAVAGPEASFFLVFDDEKRRPIDPYQWIDKSILDHRPQPEPEPQPVATTVEAISTKRKDTKLTRALELIEAERSEGCQANYQDRVDAAVNRWRGHAKGTGNHEFFVLAVSLASAGMDRNEIERTLHAEVMFARGAKSQRHRRAAIPDIMGKLRRAA